MTENNLENKKNSCLSQLIAFLIFAVGVVQTFFSVSDLIIRPIYSVPYPHYNYEVSHRYIIYLLATIIVFFVSGFWIARKGLILPGKKLLLFWGICVVILIVKFVDFVT